MPHELTDFDRSCLDAAIDQARESHVEGGIPIGAALAINGSLVSVGHNRREQLGDPILHAEMDCLRSAGRLSPLDYADATIYSTLFPCAMCSGTILMFGIPRVVIADAHTWSDPFDLLANQGREVIVDHRADVAELLQSWIDAHPDDWSEDVGGRV